MVTLIKTKSNSSYLYSTANCSESPEQSTNSPCSARWTGQYSKNSPRDILNSEGVTLNPCIDATRP